MKRATAPQIRQSLELAAALKDIGLRFVPIPVANEADFNRTLAFMHRKLKEIETMCVKEAP